MIEIIKNLLKGIVSHPVLARRVRSMKASIYKEICQLSVDVYSTPEPITLEEVQKVKMQSIKKGDRWAQKYGACWLHIVGELDQSLLTNHNVVLLNIHGEGLAFVDGKPTDIVTTIMSVADIFQAPGVGKRVIELPNNNPHIDIWVDCGYNGINGKFVGVGGVFDYCTLAQKNESLSDYYYDYLTMCLLVVAWQNSGQVDTKKIINILDESYKYYQKNDLVSATNVLKGFYSNIDNANLIEYTMIGQAHLDLAWLWAERESKRKALRTFTNALSMIKKNPDYIFGASQAQMFEWVQKSNPYIFGELQKAVANGNIDIQGGMWVECDCNMAGGESIIRQFLYGDRYFLENFGKTSDTCWLPDAFGFSNVLPKIISGVGKHNFMTIKLWRNKVNQFPYQAFWWCAPDGSKVLSYISPEGTYCNDGSPLAVAKATKRNNQKQTKLGMLVYGNGDGGGGPGEAHIEILKRTLGLNVGAKTVISNTDAFFNKLRNVNNLPEYADELYLETHQGTFTSQALNKKYNRFLERELHTLEWLLATYKIDLPEREQIWKTLLFNQFHDVLPGSSINRVHAESQTQLKSTIEYVQNQIKQIIEQQQGAKVQGLFAINSAPFDFCGINRFDGVDYLVDCKAYSSAKITAATSDCGQRVGADFIENNKIKVQFAVDGSIKSYYDKSTDSEFAAKGGLNKFMLFNDKKSSYDAWDISSDYHKHGKGIKLISMSSSIDGARACMQQEYAFSKSTIKQVIYILDSCQVYFETTVVWNESHKMLRVLFEPTIYSQTADCDLQFGSIQRSTLEDNPLDKAKFEVCAHKYIAVGNDRIFALYNDCKYGFRAKNGIISMNLLRSPKYPDPKCDMGMHTFKYSMDVQKDRANVVANAYLFNQPLGLSHFDCGLSPLVVVNNKNVILETIKPAEKGNAYVIRLYERFGIQTQLDLTITKPYSLICECDLEENGESSVELPICISPYQIKTFKIYY